MACDVQDASLLTYSGPADWCRRARPACSPYLLLLFFLPGKKSAKRLLSGERYPSRFVIHRFSPCILGDHLFFSSVLGILCVSCALDVYPESAHVGRATALCPSLACVYMYDGDTGKRAILSRWPGFGRMGDRLYLHWSPARCCGAIIGRPFPTYIITSPFIAL